MLRFAEASGVRKFFQSLSRSASSVDDPQQNQLSALIDEVEGVLERTLGGTRGLLGVGEPFLAFEGICTAVIDAPVALSTSLLDRLVAMAQGFNADGIVAELNSIRPDDTHRAWMDNASAA